MENSNKMKNRIAAAMLFFTGLILVFVILMFLPFEPWKKVVMAPVLGIFLWKIAKAGGLA